MKTFWPNWGWGFFFVVVDFVGLFWGNFLEGVVIFLGLYILGIFLGEGFSKSWHNFLLGVDNFGEGGCIFLGNFCWFSKLGLSSSLGGLRGAFFLVNFRGKGFAGSSVPPAWLGRGCWEVSGAGSGWLGTFGGFLF